MPSFLKSLFCSAAVLVLLGLSNTFAVQITMSTFDAGSSGNYRFDPGTDFPNLNYEPGATDGTWYGTFCVEMNEYFSPGGVYQVAFSSAAVNGGVSTGPDGTATSDPISKGTEAIYRNFALGTLDDYLTGFHYGNESDAAAVQNLIWGLEGELTLGANPFLSSFLSHFGGSWDDAAIAFGGTTGVQVMNLTASDGRHQDQLVYLSVPDGGLTVMLLGIGFAGLAAVRRYTFPASA